MSAEAEVGEGVTGPMLSAVGSVKLKSFKDICGEKGAGGVQGGEKIGAGG